MITFEHVSKRYEDGTLAVDDLSLECATGEITVLVGSSGCGKTTSLRMINRLVDPSSGVVAVDGRDIRESAPAELRRGMGYVIQHGGLFPHRTIVDNITTVPRLLGRSKAESRQRAAELMDLVGLTPDMARRYPHQLSGGQQQRVGVARALAADPPVLLMDEPFSAVDPVVRAELQQELLHIQAQLHKTIVFVTHDIDEAVKLGDRIAVMQVGGLLVQFDTPERVLAAPADQFVERFLGVDRGVRWLSFLSSEVLSLAPATTAESGVSDDQLRAAGTEWVLVVDSEQRPLGWRETARPGDGLRPIGHTFVPATDSVRAALDAVVLSPAGLAVAVDPRGALLGVAGYDVINKAIANAGGRA
ncbi:MAG TPA: ABC transporter ATP-binding protein [Acidimicrobiales bacterium]|jgi:osmoprotectant transport system ATP-binding protein|nr:ABC transporter ATP-binding protein [Acidimicrobiales bacterium]